MPAGATASNPKLAAAVVTAHVVVLTVNICAYWYEDDPPDQKTRKWLVSTVMSCHALFCCVSNSKLAAAVVTAHVVVLTVNVCIKPSEAGQVQTQIQ